MENTRLDGRSGRGTESPAPFDASARRELVGVGRVLRVIVGPLGFERLSPGAMRPASHYGAVLDAAFARGVDAIDTAPLYGFGEGERVVGEWLRRSGARATVLTKVGLSFDREAQGDVFFESPDASGRAIVVRKDARPRAILAQLEQSRERLGVDRLAHVSVHHRDLRVPIDETMGALVDAWRAGVLGAIGVSSFGAADLEAAARAVDRLSAGALRLSSTQGLYNLLQRDVERDVLKVVRARSIGFLAFSPLAQGLLAGAADPSRAIADFRAASPLFSTANRREIAARVERELAPLSRRHGVSVSALALAWVLSREHVTAAVVGARDAAQITRTLDALRLVSGDHPIDPRVLDRVGDAFSTIELATSAPTRSGLLRRLLGGR